MNLEIDTIINSTIRKTHDSLDNEIFEIESALNEILSRVNFTKKNRCEICNSSEPHDYLELHHIAGRKHDCRMITVCKNCHRWLSEKQKTWDKRWLRKNSSKSIRISFFLQGLQDILVLKSIKTSNSTYQKLANGLTNKISAYSEQDWRENYAIL